MPFGLQVGYLHLSNPARLQELMNLLGVGTPNAATLISGSAVESDADVLAADETDRSSDDETDSGLEGTLESSSEDAATA